MQPTKHNCQHFLADMQLLIDGELDRHKESLVRQEMQQCPKCLQFFQNQSKFKQTISTRITRMSCGDDFKQSLLTKIRGL